ncbi:unnamed protein product [Musa acuminata subsp. malaccensis]|uniref:(wild Malaysian banana) hypothetical protein n=1 Tax=Musa acuminata subsp. malaccensis TaxID=214687 RepID=A0A8D7F0C0_MUSAM|nr:unnamed protein product [Musa acuminata subsp. malaccensis]
MAGILPLQLDLPPLLHPLPLPAFNIHDVGHLGPTLGPGPQHHEPSFPRHHLQRHPHFPGQLRHPAPRPAALLQHHCLPRLPAHVHPPVAAHHARPRARSLLQPPLLHRAPPPGGDVEGLRAPRELPLRLRGVTPDDVEPAAREHPAALVALPRHVGQLHPRVRRHVVGQRRPQRVLALVVPAGHEHRGALLRGRAREEGAPWARHGGPAAPGSGHQVVYVYLVGGGPGARVPPADNHQLPPDGGQLAEQREAVGPPGDRWQRAPGAGCRLEKREAVEQPGRVRLLAVGGRRDDRGGIGLGKHDHGPVKAHGFPVAVEGRRLEVVLPELADGLNGAEGVEGDADETLAGDLLRQPWNQLVLHKPANLERNNKHRGDDEAQSYRKQRLYRKR